MYRREYLKASVLPLTSSLGTDTEPSCFSSGELGFSDLEKIREYLRYFVPNYIDDDWKKNDLVEAISETVDLLCYAYGELEDINKSVGFEKGVLSDLTDFDLSSLQNNEDFFDWMLERFSDIVDFVADVDLFPDKLSDELKKVNPRLRNYTEFIPFAWALRGMLDTGCKIHKYFEKNREVEMKTYISFCKYAGLFLIECLLLAVGSSAPYRVAFKATGAVNRAIINHIGKNIGWTLYSWLLSGIHWCIRVIFSESVDQAITAAVTNASEALVEDIQTATKGTISKQCADRTVEYQVRQLVHYQGEPSDLDYQRWRVEKLIAREKAQAKKKIQSYRNFQLNLSDLL